jgi:hypothetical protein
MGGLDGELPEADHAEPKLRLQRELNFLQRQAMRPLEVVPAPPNRYTLLAF